MKIIQYIYITYPMRIVKLYENGENECEPSRLKGTAGIKIEVMCLISQYHLCFFTSISRVSLYRCYFASLHPSPFFFLLSAFHQHRPITNRPPFLFYVAALPFAPPNLRCLSSPLLNRRRFLRFVCPI
jgi:hypothetical protein